MKAPKGEGQRFEINRHDLAYAGQMTGEQQAQAFRFPEGLELHKAEARFARDALRNYSVLSMNDEDWRLAQAAALNRESVVDPVLDSCLGMVIGNAVGDALGAPMEFKSVEYGTNALKDMGDENWTKTRFFLKPGQWTDDASMALCLADSLLVHGQLNPKDLRLRFLNWWEFGYCNAFALDEERRGGSSIGLGGNISMSFGEFKRNQGDFTSAGDTNVSGNGSVMRNSPVPCLFWDNVEKAMEQASMQSRTTHQGVEASECCRLMSFICCMAAQNRKSSAREILQMACDHFKSPVYSVQCLARSQNEEEHESNAKMDLKDRVWNWKDENYRYSPTRAERQPGYVGSYCMDAVAMSLHAVWTTESFRDAVLKVANMRGDADSVAAVAAQIAGAIYGVRQIPVNWIEAVQQWDRGTIALRAYKLWAKKRVTEPTAEELDRRSLLDREFFATSTPLSVQKKK